MIIGHVTQRAYLHRLIDKESLGHGYLFFGPAHAGKFRAALELARYAEAGGTGGNENSPLVDCVTVEPDENGAIGIDAARETKSFLARAPLASPYRIAVVRDAERLTPEAQNALLKLAEEPFARAALIFIASDPDGLLPTLRSRLSGVHFGEVESHAIEKWLNEQGVPPADANRAARLSGGAPGLAWAMLHDRAFLAYRAQAETFLTDTPASRTARLKELSKDEEWVFDRFLEALLVILRSRDSQNFPLWHEALRLRKTAAYTNVNPRMQLQALAQLL